MKFIVNEIQNPPLMRTRVKVNPCLKFVKGKEPVQKNHPVDTSPAYVNPDAYSLLGYPYGRKLVLDDIVTFIKSIVMAETGYELHELQEKTRKSEVVRARHMIMFFLRRFTKMSLSQIGRLFSKNHATVLHSCKTWSNWYETDIQIKKVTDKINFNIKEYLTNREDYKSLPTSGDVIADWDRVKYKYVNIK